jgi:RNA polymerase sigma-70 factor (ECF subfamily)
MRIIIQDISSTPEMDTTESTDAALIQAIGLGCEDAFVELYRRRRDDVYRFGLAMSRSPAFAEDVTQDVFLNVLEHANRFDVRKGSVRAWLFGCARHRIIDRLRRDQRSVDELPAEPPVPAEAEWRIAEDQRLALLHRAILALPDEYREALVVCELLELSYAEAAMTLACPIGTVRSRLHRARALLAARLRAPAEENRSPRPVNVSEVGS